MDLFTFLIISIPGAIVIFITIGFNRINKKIYALENRLEIKDKQKKQISKDTDKKFEDMAKNHLEMQNSMVEKIREVVKKEDIRKFAEDYEKKRNKY